MSGSIEWHHALLCDRALHRDARVAAVSAALEDSATAFVTVNPLTVPGEPELPWLFDVQGDIGERRHLEQRHPEIVKELLGLIKGHQASFATAPTQR